jgi:protein-S-isoprenylcysteine O-methyltransferase Ste14
MLGFTFASNQWWALIVSGLFWWFYYPPAVEYEDRKLEALFGDEWRAWSVDVPAVVPRNLRIREGGSWSLRTSWSENYELIIVAYTLICLYIVARQLG